MGLLVFAHLMTVDMTDMSRVRVRVPPRLCHPRLCHPHLGLRVVDGELVGLGEGALELNGSWEGDLDGAGEVVGLSVGDLDGAGEPVGS